MNERQIMDALVVDAVKLVVVACLVLGPPCMFLLAMQQGG